MNDLTRRKVQQSYGKAIINKKDNTNIAVMSEYSSEDADDELLSQSFGCGNPLAFSKLKEGDVVLDLGSGAGLDVILAAKRVGEKGLVIGVDMTDEMLARARENVESEKLTNVELRKGYIEHLPIEDSSVDWVFSNCVINVSPQKQLVFKEIYRVLKPEGQFVISDIVVEKFPPFLRLFRPLLTACVAGAISEEKYIKTAQEQGLQGLKVINRMIYEKSQIKQIIEDDEIPGLKSFFSALPRFIQNWLLRQTAGAIVSVKISGSRQATPVG